MDMMEVGQIEGEPSRLQGDDLLHPPKVCNPFLSPHLNRYNNISNIINNNYFPRQRKRFPGKMFTTAWWEASFDSCSL